PLHHCHHAEILREQHPRAPRAPFCCPLPTSHCIFMCAVCGTVAQIAPPRAREPVQTRGRAAGAYRMMGKPQRREEKLFYVGLTLEDRVPADHLLRQIDRAIDFGFVRAEVAHLYGVNGHESLDPALVLRVMLLMFLDNVRSEREFMRQLPLRLDWLWFCRLELD